MDNQTTSKLQNDGWRRIRWWGIVRLTSREPEEKLWRFEHEQRGDRRRSVLVSPSGVRWQFKLARGSFSRPEN